MIENSLDFGTAGHVVRTSCFYSLHWATHFKIKSRVGSPIDFSISSKSSIDIFINANGNLNRMLKLVTKLIVKVFFLFSNSVTASSTSSWLNLFPSSTPSNIN